MLSGPFPNRLFHFPLYLRYLSWTNGETSMITMFMRAQNTNKMLIIGTSILRSQLACCLATRHVLLPHQQQHHIHPARSKPIERLSYSSTCTDDNSHYVTTASRTSGNKQAQSAIRFPALLCSAHLGGRPKTETEHPAAQGGVSLVPLHDITEQATRDKRSKQVVFQALLRYM